jgi:hypothetical protein
MRGRSLRYRAARHAPLKKFKTTMKCALTALVAIAGASPLLATTYPDCQGWKPPPELKGKKAVETNFVGPSGGAVIILRIGNKILCESVETGVPAKERSQAERQVLTGKMHTPAIKDFNAGYAGPDCTSEYQDCYDPNSPNYPDADACAQYQAHCR